MWLVTIAFLGWLTNMAMASATTPTDPGHLFIPIGKTYPSYSSWAISISINISAFRQESENLFLVKKNLEHLVNVIQEENTDTSKPRQFSIAMYINQLGAAITELNAEAVGLRRDFNDLLYPASWNWENPLTSNLSPSELELPRKKRGLIDGIGKAFSYLFGTATESEITHLVNNVRLLNQKDMVMAHQFNGTLQVLNSTRIAATENRRALRIISQAVRTLEAHYNVTMTAVHNDEETTELSFKLSALTSTVTRATQAIQYLYAELSSLAHKFALAQAGILHKHLIPRNAFQHLLHQISRSLPSNFQLPFSEETPDEYVRIVKPKLVEDRDVAHILFYIPLLHTKHAFDIFKFFPYHVPMHDHNVSLVYYQDEPPYLLMSEDRQHFIQPENSEIEQCILTKQPYCPLHEPAYTTTGSRSCIVALFRKDPDDANTLCSPRILPSTSAPKAYYLANGKWLLVSRPPLHLTIMCASKSRPMIISNPVDILTLEPECSASSDSFYLPPYYASESHLDLPSIEPHHVFDNLSLPIWRPTWSSALRNVSVSPSSPPSLPPLHINGMVADAYFNQITALPLEQVTTDSPSAFSRSMLLMIIIGVLSLCCLIFCLQHCCVPRGRYSVTRLHFPRRPRGTPEPEEPAMELQESEPMVTPPVVAVPAPYHADDPEQGQQATYDVPTAGMAAPPVSSAGPPVPPAPVAPMLPGTRPTPYLSPLV